MTQDNTREALAELVALIASDSYAISFQTMGQYRTALLKAGRAALSSQPPAPSPQSTDEIAQRLRINRTWTGDTAWASGVGVTAISASEPFDGDPAYAMRRAVERVASKIEQQLLAPTKAEGASK